MLTIDNLNLEAVHLYLSYKHVPQPISATPGKVRVPVTVRCPTFSPLLLIDEEEIVNKLDEILTRQVEKLLTPDTAILCSGGLDSGIVTAIAAKLHPGIETFNLTYREETEGKAKDREYARTISETFQTRHHEPLMSFGEIVAYLPEIIKVIGEPFSGYVTPWFIGRALNKFGVKHVLTGDWGDELFGSYLAHRLAYEYPMVSPCHLRASTFVFSDSEKNKLYSKEMSRRVENTSTINHTKQYFENLTATDNLNQMLESEFKSFYPDQTCLAFKLLTECWSIETVSPYAQPEFADFAARIPGEIKMKDNQTKYILKKLGEKYLPSEIVYRKKEGFVTPTMALCKAQEVWIREKLTACGKSGLFDNDYVQFLANRFYKLPTDSESYKIWNLVSLQVFLEG